MNDVDVFRYGGGLASRLLFAEWRIEWIKGLMPNHFICRITRDDAEGWLRKLRFVAAKVADKEQHRAAELTRVLKLAA
jgi:hypothetical protein